MTAAVKTLSSNPMTVKVFGVTPSRASGCMSCITKCLTRCCMRLLNIYLLYHTLYLEKRGCRDGLCCTHAACLTSLFAHPVMHPAQIVLHCPEPATRSAQTSLYSCTYILHIFPLKPGATASNSIECMSVAIAELRPAVDL